jgi:hypothetical protein
MKRTTVGLALSALLLSLFSIVSVAQEEPLQNTLRWSTASEVDNFGFDVYRSTSEDGQFDLLNEKPLLGKGTSDVPTEYAYVDITIEEGVVYYYYVESIAMDGTRERFTPIMKSPAKYKPGNEPDDG